MLNEIQLGVVYSWSTYDPDCNYEPLTLLVEGGRTQNEAEWKALMTTANDDGFKLNTIAVYGVNFADSSNVKETTLEK